MRTLDEVIKGFECCKEVGCGECPYKILFDDDSHVPCDQFEKDDDALQWLKGYKVHIELDKLRDKYGVTSQKLRNTSQITCPKCHSEFVILPDANNPLTWDELKSMEGKPVWIENKHFSHYKFWGLISVIRHRQGHDYLVIKIPKNTNLHLYDERYLNDGWQAYKKERE